MRIEDKMTSLLLYEMTECGHECADYVATIDFTTWGATILSPDGYGFRRIALWDDMDELLIWAANVHDVDPWDAILVDPKTGRTVHYLQ